jgi:beta-lactam-binding protein with PASTA domain
VVDTDPPAGAVLESGDSVLVSVSRGGDIVEVPSLIGKTLEEAGTLLRGVQLEIGETTFAEESGTGTGDAVVVGQDPPSGGLARSGTAVNVRLGQAPVPVRQTE